MCVRSETNGSDGPATFGLGETAPDSVRFLDLECIGAALAHDGTDLTHSFRTHLASLPFIFSFLGTRREEEMGVVATTQRDRLPGTIWGHQGVPFVFTNISHATSTITRVTNIAAPWPQCQENSATFMRILRGRASRRDRPRARDPSLQRSQHPLRHRSQCPCRRLPSTWHHR